MLSVKRLWKQLRGNNRPLISHDSSESENLPCLPDNSEFVRKGNGLTTIETVGQNVILTISENGRLRITGNIDRACSIFIEGKGTLTIDGLVANDLELTVYGQGNVIFTQRPHENVIAAINKRSGTGQITCAGVNLFQLSNSYMHHNLGRAAGSQPQPLAPVQPSAMHQPSANRSHAPSSIENIDIFNEHTRAYIDSFKDKEKIADRIEGLNLTAEEEPLFEKFIEGITFTYYDDIPVRCNGRFYNLNTILELYKTNQPDPFEKIPLRLANIDDGREIYNQLDKTIIKLNKKRSAAVDIELPSTTVDLSM